MILSNVFLNQTEVCINKFCYFKIYQTLPKIEICINSMVSLINFNNCEITYLAFDPESNEPIPEVYVDPTIEEIQNVKCFFENYTFLKFE